MSNKNDGRCVLYEALGVSCEASEGDVRKAFTKLAHTNNPDRNMDHTDWNAVNENFAFLLFSYKILRNSETRNVYDRSGFQGLKSRGISVPAGYEAFKPASQTKETQTESSDLGEMFRKKLNITRTGIFQERKKNTKTERDDLDLRRKRYVYRSRQSHSVYHMSLPTGDFAEYKNLIKFAWKKEMTKYHS